LVARRYFDITLEVAMPQQANVVLPVIESMGVSIWDPMWAIAEHTSWCCEIVHIIKGSVRVHSGDGVLTGRTGDTLYMPAQVRHRDEFPLDSPFEVLHIQFHCDDPQLLPDQRAADWLAGLPLRPRKRLAQKLRELYEAFSREGVGSEEYTRALLYALLLDIRESSRAPAAPARPAGRSQSRHAQTIALARDFIGQNLGRALTLADIAAHLGMSAYHLSHIFSRESGFSLSSYLTRSRMEKAQAMLADPRVRVSEVAYAVGFSDANYFAKSFRRHAGCSPSEYRERAHGSVR
jgi:AraC-like DNA-binding protein